MKVPQIKTTDFPAARSRVAIQLPKGMKPKPNANTRTLRPDKCLVVSLLSPRLRFGCRRNIGDNAITTRASPVQIAFATKPCFLSSRKLVCLI